MNGQRGKGPATVSQALRARLSQREPQRPPPGAGSAPGRASPVSRAPRPSTSPGGTSPRAEDLPQERLSAGPINQRSCGGARDYGIGSTRPAFLLGVGSASRVRARGLIFADQRARERTQHRSLCSARAPYLCSHTAGVTHIGAKPGRCWSSGGEQARTVEPRLHGGGETHALPAAVCDTADTRRSRRSLRCLRAMAVPRGSRLGCRLG